MDDEEGSSPRPAATRTRTQLPLALICDSSCDHASGCFVVASHRRHHHDALLPEELAPAGAQTRDSELRSRSGL
eukprot:1848303-Rhodomonas_salina.1